MKHAAYVPLHVHTEYSLLDGAIRIDELVKQASDYRMPALAVTDHGNLFGAIEFYRKAIKAGIKPIIGCEVYVAPQSRFERTKSSIDPQLQEEAAFHLILLARNMTGYKNLTRLVTRAYLEGFYYKPRIDKELLDQYSGGLIGLSSCLKGEVPYCLQYGQLDRAREVALQYKHILGPENFFLELQHNGLPEQEDTNRKLVELSRDVHIPVVATNDCHYLRREDAKAHDILLCIQTGKTIKDEKRLRFETDQFYFKSPQEMMETFRKIPEAIDNTIVIAERCNLDFAFGKNLLPHFQAEEATPEAQLETLAVAGLAAKFSAEPPAPYRDRLAEEINIIKKTGYASYFLIVWDFISYAKNKGIPVGPGRGSAAGSLVAYCLGITEVDPIKYGLVFERFLNPERVSMPDIDVDFCKDRRQEVIKYVADKYGKDNVAQIITFGTMASKAAIRDVGRVLDIPYAEVDRIAKLVPAGLEVKTIDDALKIEPQLKELYDTNPVVRELLDIAKRLEGLARHASTHAAGVVIAPEPLTEFTALYKNPSEDTITTQLDMGAVEKVGLLKFDFLGLKTLTVLDKTVQFIRQQDREIRLLDFPLDDPATYRLLSSGETTGIFQLESSGMRDILTRLQPSRFEDLIALVALYRPGPMAWIDDFIKGKKREREVTYILPELRDILEETYGIFLYQEQVMLTAHKIAGFTMSQADILRKAMGKKIPEMMDLQKENFIRGAVQNGISAQKAKEIFEHMEPFAKYGFNKSHSAAYALVAYQTAYLKAHYPVEFMTANLSADMGDTDKVVKLINECKNLALQVLPPDINESAQEFKIAGSSIRFGLEAVKGVGSSAIDVIIKERQKGSFRSFEDFLSRVDGRRVNKKVIESLVRAGAFDSLYNESPQTIRPRLVRICTLPHAGLSNGPGLFEDGNTGTRQIDMWNESVLLSNEREALGFYISGHPLTQYRRTLESMGVAAIGECEGKDDRSEVGVAGVVTEVRSKAREKGVTAYISIEDETGSCELLIFPDIYKKHHQMLKKGNLIVVRGLISSVEKGVKVIAKDIQDLGNVEISTKYEVTLKCDEMDSDKLKHIKRLLNGSTRGQAVSLSFNLYNSDYCVVIATTLQPSHDFISEVQRITGGTVKVI